MGLRETINRKPSLALVGAVALLTLATVVIYLEYGPARPGPNADTGKIHFTTDDGATWFPDSVDKYPQFKKDGKDAYRANVYRGADGKEFVAYLERRATQSSTAAEEEEEAVAASMTPEQRALNPTAALTPGIEVKRPGEKTWYRDTDPRAQQIMRPRLPSGKTDGLTYVQAR